MTEKIEHRSIDPGECPRCGGHRTESLGDDGTPTETRVCLDCEAKNPEPGMESYDVVRGDEIESVNWCDKEGEYHTVYDSDYLVRQAAKDLHEALSRWRDFMDKNLDTPYRLTPARLCKAIDEAIEKATPMTSEEAWNITARAMVQAVDGPKSEDTDPVPANTIRITVEGGLIQDIERGPGTEETKVVVWDFDTEGAEEQDLSRNAKGEEFIESEW